MSKLYYNDPLVAAYMAREFGVKSRIHAYGDESCLEFKYSNDWSDIVELWICEEQADERGIHPDSCHIFEPIDGDEWRVGDWIYLYCDGDNNCNYNPDTCMNKEEFEESDKPKELIVRDGKQFFTPEVDNG